jgi:hypothetical protein
MTDLEGSTKRSTGLADLYQNFGELKVMTRGDSYLTTMNTRSKQMMYPRKYSPFKKTWENWVAKWWTWCMKCEMEGCNPLLDSTGKYCAANQIDPDVWFLAGTAGGDTHRKCVIDHGKAVFFPIINDLISYSEYQQLKTRSDLLNYSKSDLDETRALSLDVDNVQFTNLRQYRVRTDLFDIVLPSNHYEGYSTVTQATSDGYWAFLKPLSSGIHTIHFKGEKLAYDDLLQGRRQKAQPKFKVEVKYQITIPG